MATEYLEKRQLRDLTALQKKLSLHLEKDIQILHSRNEFYDLLLHWDHEDIQIKVHQCILKARTPAFLNQLLCLSSQPGNLCIDLSNYNSEKVSKLVEKIYSNSEVFKLESEVVQHLKDKVIEKFYTPACTPIDGVTQALYYSLVTVDSDYSSYGTVNVDKELEEQDLLSRSFELIRNKKSQARRASSGNVRKIVKSRVKMSKTVEDSSTKTRQTVPVHASSNGGGVSISSREHTTSDTSGVDVNESSTSSLTEPEIWDSTEHEDNDDEFDFFDDKTLHANDPPLVDKSPLIFSPDTLKPAPGSHYIPLSDFSDQTNEPASLASNASSNFFIDASSLLDENECLLAKKDEGVCNGDILPVLGSPKIIEASLQDNVLTENKNADEGKSNVLRKPSAQSPSTNQTSIQKPTELECMINAERTQYETFIISCENGEYKDFLQNKQTGISSNIFSDQQITSFNSPYETFIKDKPHSPKELVYHATDNVKNVPQTRDDNLFGVEPTDNALCAAHVVSNGSNNEHKISPLNKQSCVTSDLNDNTNFHSVHRITDDVSQKPLKKPITCIDEFFKGTTNVSNNDSAKRLDPISITNQVDDNLSPVKPVSSPFTNGFSRNLEHSDRDVHNVTSTAAKENDLQLFVMNKSLNSTHFTTSLLPEEPKTFIIESDTKYEEEPKTFIIDLDKNRTFDLVSEIFVNNQKTTSHETIDLNNETIDLAPSLQDPFDTQHIIPSYEKRGLNSNQTFDLVQSSMLPIKETVDEVNYFTFDVHRNIPSSRKNVDFVEKEKVGNETPTIPSPSASNYGTMPSEKKTMLCDKRFSFDKTDGTARNSSLNENNHLQSLQKSRNENSRTDGVNETVSNSVADSYNERLHQTMVISHNQNSAITNSKQGNTTNPFINMNPFIDYSEQNSLISTDSIDTQHARGQGCSNVTARVAGLVEYVHDNGTNFNANVTKINNSSNPNVNQINTSFSSTNPFLNDIQNDAMKSNANVDNTFVVATSQSTKMTPENFLGYPANEEIQEKHSGKTEIQQDGVNNLGKVQNNLGSIEVQENQLNRSLDAKEVNKHDSQVVYRRNVEKYEEGNNGERCIQHSTPLSASVDNLLEMNCTPIKLEDSNTFNLNATQIKRLSCKLNDENLSKANEQLNLLLSGDSNPSSNQYADSNFSDSLQIENCSQTLCPSKTQGVAHLDLILSRGKTCDDFHSPDSLNADEVINATHLIDEDNRSKNSSDIDCLPIVSGGVSLKDIDIAPASPRQSIEKQSTSWTVDFTGERMTRSVNHPSAVTTRDTLSKSSSSLVKHGDSFSHNNKSCGFYIDLNEPCPESRDGGGKPRTKSAGDSEKKMFNIFIDISNSDSSDKEKSNKSPRPLLRKKMKPLSVTDRFLARQCSNEEGNMRSSAEESDGEHPEIVKGKTLFKNMMTPPPSTQTSTTDQSMSDLTESGGGGKKQNGGGGFFMFIGADPTPVVKRRLSSGGSNPGNAAARTNPNRHSWNSDSSGQAGAPPPSSSSAASRKHRRAASVSCKLSDLDTSPSAPIPEDSKLTSSWHAASTGNKKLMDSSDSSVLADTHSDATSGSLKSDATYNIDTGVTNGTEEVGFKSIPEDAAVDTTNDTSSERNDTYVIEGKEKCNGTLVPETPTIVEDKSDSINKKPDGSKPAGHQSVKLSDMDCPPSQRSKSPLPPPSRLSRSHDGGGRELVQGSRSLTRLFPHLLGGSLSSSQEDGHTTISTVSSLQSSNNRSTLDVSTDEGEGSGVKPVVKSPSTLGADLLRMFLEEISADVTVEVAGRRIRAHKCVLSSRCQYFAAVLSGGWVESSGNVISLQGYSYSSVHFALCHIYSGAGDMPENINVVELATLADMLCLEGLKEVISAVLKHKYCHYFHKPCNTCLLGVIEVLPLAAAYGLDDIYRKSLRWIAKHFVRVWPTKAFGSMPKELIDKCLKQILVHMTSDNVLDTLMSAEKVQALLPSGVKWTEPITHSLNKLQDACAKYIAQHLSSVLTSAALLTLSRDELWDIGTLESILLGAGSKLSPDEACRAYVQLDVMLHQTPEPTWHESFGRALSQLGANVKACLVRQAGKACRSPAWQLIPPRLRRDIQESAGLILVPGDEKRRARMMRKSTTGAADAKKIPAEFPSNEKNSHGTPMMRRSTGCEGSYASSRSLDLQQQPKKPPVPDLIPRAKPKFSEVKSRYLDTRPSRYSDPAPPERKSASTSSSSSVTHTRAGGNHGNHRAATGISSSESSRQSSPALSKRNMNQVKEKSTSRLSLDSKLEPCAQQKKQDMKLIRETLTLNIRKSHETDDSAVMTSQDFNPVRNIKEARVEKITGVVKKIPSVATATRLPMRNNENKASVLTKSLSSTQAAAKKTPDTKLTRSSRLSLDNTRNSRLSFDSVRKPHEAGSAKVGSRLSLETKSLRSSPLDNRTRESLRASTDRLSVDTLSSRNKRRTGSSSSITSCSSGTKASTPNMNKKPLNINRSPIKMNKTALLRSSAGLSLRNSNAPAPTKGPASTQEDDKKLGTRSGTFCLDESTSSILKNINTSVS